MKKSFLFISCDEAKHICDKAQYGEASSWERLKLKLRISWCHITKSYTKKNTKLTDVMQKAEVNCLKNDERANIQKKFKKQLAKHQN
ncbi:hypothetical protein [Winogradskyella alexanderae]|uniref:Glycine dehydrogenase n=1 Tax=Winogradskyella alexanderae TaxID=2877123 RepID=A0ABS7XU83_9FLAO|nr:hypothetical protein [Winogradskyella alexanderae]MCA0133592.1 hypothetical protein [Winogradskyella alexanderae]